ncbi:hypothetical protein [Okeania sp.]|uniref:hypothetical protein n=1 Tax=Okeania sp. TaxID=3100323 RepID=UPI002B4AD1C1|nr:hypothetical protein [Okeania sp.]MEB3339312.1 hypothetical protein [Okeania sp.]
MGIGVTEEVGGRIIFSFTVPEKSAKLWQKILDFFSFQDLKSGTFDLPKNAKKFISKGFHF